jgi:glycosyltransferase involved in cell wall biosynthesis
MLMIETPIKVCFPFIGDEIGGSHISALKLICNLDAREVQPLIVLHRTDGILASYIRKLGLNFVNLPNVTVIGPSMDRAVTKNQLWDYFIRTLPILRNFLLSNGIQIVHTNDGQIHATWSLPTRLSGAKLVWHHRADPTARGVNYLAPFLANHIVSVSKFAQPIKPILSVKNRVSVVHSPFDHPVGLPDRNLCREMILEELGLPENARLIGYFGGLIARKRPVLFVDILKRFISSYPDIPIFGLIFGETVQGGVPFDIAVRERSQLLNIEDHIKLMGFKHPIEPYMAGIDLMLVPAVSEPFGRTLIESMLLGTAVIATNHGGNPEAITDGVNGFLVEAESAEAFVDPMYQLLTNRDLREKIIDTARISTLEKYGIPIHVKKMTEIYRLVLQP